MTPYGRRGSICAHLGWTWDYLHHSISYATVLRIVADLPSTSNEKDEAPTEQMTPAKAKELVAMINKQR